ncbi:MAG: hybrid sensor histidine kinase/response regulator [Magnetococcales bacterium]|nr:hybrid sensor histidine kinase/response regulator [Magnetococcales bacterium]MBF0321927.1 hybrid sensor histidine kinase/response regulator [Magnetococcales bacterium]
METISKRPTILLVDDEPANLKLLREILRKDHDLLFAHNCAEMFEYAADQPDLILLDVMMPEMDGYTGCALLKANEATRDIPVIFVTAKIEMDDEIKGFAAGAVDYLTKPVQGPVVRARVKTHLALRQARELVVRQNKEIMAQYESLKKTAQLRDDVEHIVRHDLKGPLNAIIGMPEVVINDGPLTETQEKFLHIIEESGYLLLDMINRSHDLYKMEQGIYQIDAKPVNILVILGRVLTELQQQIHEKKLLIDITLNSRPVVSTDLFLVSGEELLYHSMFSNLLKNAVEASPAKQSLMISLKQKEKPVIRISNKGSVPVVIRDNFFGKYVTSGKQQGTGLGTYSAMLIAKTSGGDLLLDTTREGMTSIIIKLKAWTDCSAS